MSADQDSDSGRKTTGHEWDGIREYDTPLPLWWLYTFYATIVFAVVWCVFNPSLPTFDGILGRTTRQKVAADIAMATKAQDPFIKRILALTPEEIRKDPELYAFARVGGRIAFNNNCAPCHQSGGAGTKGYPNLADDDWLWANGTLADIEQTIRYGIRSDNDKARTSTMPRFGMDGLLEPAQIDVVVEYVLSLGHLPYDAAAAVRGATVYADQCVACHMPGGVGNRELGAPALNDAIWLNGGDRASVRASVYFARMGVMPAWQGRLDEATIKMLTLYVHGLGGGK